MRTMRTILLPGVLSFLMFSGCFVHHRRHHRGPPPEEVEGRPPPEEPPDRTPPPPDRTPPPPRTHRAPPAPEVQVTLSRTSARRGQEIEVFIKPFNPSCGVFFNGRPLPKKTRGGGFAVTVPGNANSGHFEAECAGRRYRSPHLTVTP